MNPAPLPQLIEALRAAIDARSHNATSARAKAWAPRADAIDLAVVARTVADMAPAPRPPRREAETEAQLRLRYAATRFISAAEARRSEIIETAENTTKTDRQIGGEVAGLCRAIDAAEPYAAPPEVKSNEIRQAIRDEIKRANVLPFPGVPLLPAFLAEELTRVAYGLAGMR